MLRAEQPEKKKKIEDPKGLLFIWVMPINILLEIKTCRMLQCLFISSLKSCNFGFLRARNVYT